MKLNPATSSLGSLLEKWNGNADRTTGEDSTFRRFSSQLAQAAEDPPPSCSADVSSKAIVASLSCFGQTETPIQYWGTTMEQTASGKCMLNPSSASSLLAATVAPATPTATAQNQQELTEVSPAVPWTVTFRDRAEWSSELGNAAKDAVKAELAKAGIDPATVKMSYWEEVCWYPGGNFVLKNITIQTPNGEKCDFDAAATARSPHVTARDVIHMLQA